LTVGGSKGTTELELDGATLTLNAKSTIDDSGTLAEQGYASSIAIRSPATLTNDGLLTVGPGYQLAITGNLTNASDGLVYLPANGYHALLELDGTSTFVNYGEVALQYNSEIVAPYNAKATATIDNAGGTIQNAGTIDVNAGGVFNEGAGTVTGSAPVVSNAILQLTGSGPSSFKLEGATTVSGTVAAAQTLQLGSGSVSTKASLTNEGVIVTTNYSTLSLPRGDILFNYGSVISGPGTSLALVGDVDNERGGTITVGGNAGYGSSLYLEAPYTLTNDGTFLVQAHSQVLAPFNSATGLVFDNDGGTISNAGAFDVKPGGTFKEGAGTTTGNAIFVPGGAVELAGSGAASFEMTGGALSGTIAADQTVAVVAPLGYNTIKVPASFTNDGTIFLSKGAINLPAGGTLTNNGLIECQDGSSNSLRGNLTNDTHGIVNLDGVTSYGGQLLLPLANTTFDNAGTIDLLYGSTIILQSWTQTFDNTGTINVGAFPSGSAWGGTAFDGIPIAASTTNVASQENTIVLSGTINPVLVGGLPTPYPKSPQSISYGLFEASDGGDPTYIIHLSCSASVSGGWASTARTPPAAPQT
jgi:adhesin HecA-like repeat protein